MATKRARIRIPVLSENSVKSRSLIQVWESPDRPVKFPVYFESRSLGFPLNAGRFLPV